MDDDERLARELQEQWDKEYKDHQEKQNSQQSNNTQANPEVALSQMVDTLGTKDNENLLELAQQQQVD